jgi:hypothetical protein
VGIGSEYIEAEDLLLVVWHGTVTGAEWEAFVRQRLLEEPRWPIGKRRLADITTFEPSRLGPADVDTITDLYLDRLHNLVGSRQAIVASQGWDLARKFERNIDRLGATTIVFNSLDDACAWLGIDAETARERLTTLRSSLRPDA